MFLEKKCFYLIVYVIFSMMLIGCQPKVYLMPSPVGIKPDGVLFNLTPDNKDDNLLYTFYATNRQPIDTTNKYDHYSIFPSETLRMGFVVHRVGEENMTWEEIYNASLSKNRNRDLLLTNEYTREIVTYNIKDNLQKTSSEADGFFLQINELLDKNIDKDILVYVHGANSNFYRATAQGAQFYHFMGHNAVVLTFSWPSAGNLLRYKTDVLHAKQTVPAFARLIELLANHTKARHINVLAYSAGAQVVAPGLAYFKDQYPDQTTTELKKKLRIGEVYLAAPDTAFKSFAERYVKFRDIVDRTTININKNDSVLRFSAFENGISRLGRPDANEASEEDLKILIDATRTPQLNVLDIGGSESLDIGGAHDSWYNNSWVSTDVLLLLLFNAAPLDRGLEEYWYKNGTKTYRFPNDYETRQRKIIDEYRESFLAKLKSEMDPT